MSIHGRKKSDEILLFRQTIRIESPLLRVVAEDTGKSLVDGTFIKDTNISNLTTDINRNKH